MNIKAIEVDETKRAFLGADQEGMMEGLLAAISIREDQCLTYMFPVYEGEEIHLQVEGSDGYSGRLVFDDHGWHEEVRCEWSQEILPYAEARKNLEELIESGIHRDEMNKEGRN